MKKTKKKSSWKLLKTFGTHIKSVSSISISKDGSKIVSGSHDRTIKLWKFYSGELLKTTEDHSDVLHCVCFSNDGSKIASGSEDETIKIWDVLSGELLKSFDVEEIIYSLRFSVNDAYIVSNAKSDIVIYDLKTDDIAFRLKGHLGIVFSLCFSIDGSLLISGSEDFSVKLWDAKIAQKFRRS